MPALVCQPGTLHIRSTKFNRRLWKTPCARHRYRLLRGVMQLFKRQISREVKLWQLKARTIPICVRSFAPWPPCAAVTSFLLCFMAIPLNYKSYRMVTPALGSPLASQARFQGTSGQSLSSHLNHSCTYRAQSAPHRGHHTIWEVQPSQVLRWLLSRVPADSHSPN